MSGPLPLIESSENSHARALLRAARSDGPSRGSAQRALVALGVGVATSSAVGLAGAAGSAAAGKASAGLGAVGASAGLPAIAAKWLLIGSLGGVALASGTAALFNSSRAPSESRAPSTGRVEPGAGEDGASRVRGKAASQPEVGAVAPAQPHGPQPVEPTRKPSAAGLTSHEPPATPELAPSQAAFASPEQSKVLRDVALLDRARTALRAGDPARALTELNRYDAERETHILDREAQLLRIDAWVRRGESARAAELARAYLAAFPNDSHTARLRALASKGE